MAQHWMAILWWSGTVLTHIRVGWNVAGKTCPQRRHRGAKWGKMQCRALKFLLLDLLNWCTLRSLLNRCAAMVFVSLIVRMPRVQCMLYYLISLCFMRIVALIIWNLSHEVFRGIEDIYIYIYIIFFFDLNVTFRIFKIYRPARPSCYAQANFTSVPAFKFALRINFTQRRRCEQACLFMRAMWRSLIHT